MLATSICQVAVKDHIDYVLNEHWLCFKRIVVLQTILLQETESIFDIKKNAVARRGGRHATCGLPHFTTHVGETSQSVESRGRPLLARPADAKYLFVAAEVACPIAADATPRLTIRNALAMLRPEDSPEASLERGRRLGLPSF